MRYTVGEGVAGVPGVGVGAGLTAGLAPGVLAGVLGLLAGVARVAGVLLLLGVGVPLVVGGGGAGGGGAGRPVGGVQLLPGGGVVVAGGGLVLAALGAGGGVDLARGGVLVGAGLLAADAARADLVGSVEAAPSAGRVVRGHGGGGGGGVATRRGEAEVEGPSLLAAHHRAVSTRPGVRAGRHTVQG